MKITIEVEETRDPAPLLAALRKIDSIVQDHMISGETTKASNELAVRVLELCRLDL